MVELNLELRDPTTAPFSSWITSSIVCCVWRRQIWTYPWLAEMLFCGNGAKIINLRYIFWEKYATDKRHWETIKSSVQMTGSWLTMCFNICHHMRHLSLLEQRMQLNCMFEIMSDVFYVEGYSCRLELYFFIITALRQLKTEIGGKLLFVWTDREWSSTPAALLDFTTFYSIG